MSRVSHPNVVSLFAARVLPPGYTLPACSDVDCRCALPCWRACRKWLTQRLACQSREGVAKDGACSCADYMLVMAMEGDNVAYKLHQEVLFLLSIFPLSISHAWTVIALRSLGHTMLLK